MKIYKKSVLSNGIRLVSEYHPRSRAVSVGIWVLTGTRHESSQSAGAAHFLEHLVFKGTKKRSAYKIAWELESLGGELNAFTSRENTSFQGLVLKEHWLAAVDVLCDLISNMDLRKKDFALEKGVILQEIAMSEDNYEEFIYDLFHQDVYPGQALGWSILGSIKSIAKMKISDITKHYKQHFTGKNLIVSVAGCVQHEDILKAIEKRLKNKPKFSIALLQEKPQWSMARTVYEKNTEQVHVLMGLPCSSFQDKDRYAAYLVNAWLGGGMTSLLFQSVREKKGLVYSIYSSMNTFVDGGSLLIYAATDFEKVKSVVDLIIKEIKKVQQKGLSAKALKMYKTQVIGGLLLGSDDLESRMSSLAVNEMIFEKYRPIDDIIAEIEKVSVKDIDRFIKDRLDLKKLSGVLLGSKVESLRDWWQKV
ncbi:MAG: M16 family metallopeptidase [Pseudobdellovibrionaceae bacterium]